MEFLELLESVHDILIFGKSLRHLAELLLGFEVLLEVKVAQIPVYLDFIIEFLYIELIGVIQIPETLYRNRPYSTPSRLQFTECREGCPKILLVLHKGLQIVNHGLLPDQILLPLCLLPAVELRTLLLVSGIDGLEAVLKCRKRIQRRRIAALLLSTLNVIRNYRLVCGLSVLLSHCRFTLLDSQGCRTLLGQPLVKCGLDSIRFL